jgi:hypothetical protein
MNDVQPSFFQWRKKVNAALAIDPSRVTLMFTGADGRTLSIEPEELQTPQVGTYTAKVTSAGGTLQEICADFETPQERPLRRSSEDMFFARYERMADDLENARLAAEARARAAESEKLAALETVAAQYRRIQELEHQVEELEQRGEGLLDDDTALLLLEAVDRWTGANELRGQVAELLSAIERDPRVADRIVRRVPELIAALVEAVKAEGDA